MSASVCCTLFKISAGINTSLLALKAKQLSYITAHALLDSLLSVIIQRKKSTNKEQESFFMLEICVFLIITQFCSDWSVSLRYYVVINGLQYFWGICRIFHHYRIDAMQALVVQSSKQAPFTTESGGLVSWSWALDPFVKRVS